MCNPKVKFVMCRIGCVDDSPVPLILVLIARYLLLPADAVISVYVLAITCYWRPSFPPFCHSRITTPIISCSVNLHFITPKLT